MAPLCIYIDVDETFVRNVDRKQLPIPDVITHIKALKMENATLYCWSSGGADYARQRAEAFGIADCFAAFLPKPEVLIDDCRVSEWRRLLEVHPNECRHKSVKIYRELLGR